MGSLPKHVFVVSLLLYSQLQICRYSADSLRTELVLQNIVISTLRNRINSSSCASQFDVDFNINVPKLLDETKQLVTESCEEIFQFERWNCSNELRLTALNNTDNVYKETALIYTLYSAAFAYTVLRSCIYERLNQCRCSPNYIYPKFGIEIGRDWQARACTENINYSQNFTRNFLLPKKSLRNPITRVLRQNVKFGLKAMKKSVKNVCKCRSDTSKIKTCRMICWKEIGPFRNVVRDLKEEYYNAQLVTISNKTNRKQKREGRKKRHSSMQYLNHSPNMCSTTVGRTCESITNCKILCCGRGYNIQFQDVVSRCDCQWENNFKLQCKTCKTVKYKLVCN